MMAEAGAVRAGRGAYAAWGSGFVYGLAARGHHLPEHDTTRHDTTRHAASDPTPTLPTSPSLTSFKPTNELQVSTAAFTRYLKRKPMFDKNLATEAY